MLKSSSSPMDMCASSYLFNSAKVLVAATAVLISTGCNSVNPYYNPAKPHHTAQGFQNNYNAKVTKSTGELIRWQYERNRDGLPKPPQTPTATVPPDLAFIQANAKAPAMQPAITWVGHATMLVQANGLNVLTDPVFSDRASPVQFAGPKRAQPPGLALDQLPPIDVVLISHNHYDHLDKNTVVALSLRARAATLFIVPLGVKAWFADLGITNVKELDWWDSVNVKGVEFNFTPVQHWSARGLGDRSQTLWGGWAVFGADTHWYFSGDTGYSQDFVDTQKRFADRQTPAKGGGFDMALIAVGAYEPRWFMKEQHVNPAEAVQIHQDLKAKRSVGVHWGTFALTDEPLDQPPRDLAAAKLAANIKDDDFFLLAIGQTRRIDKRNPTSP
jgi:N-acyl-phosphatidylethanolamine-hydrolysing phospholipase D